MNLKSLISKARRAYQPYYALVALAVGICSAVITGSLLVGDSVRETLLLRARERLGAYDTVVSAGEGYLDASLLAEAPFAGTAEGALYSRGFVSRAGRFIPVQVWGVDRLPDGSALAAGEAAFSPALARELDGDTDVVLRLARNSLVPAGSLFVSKQYTAALRLRAGRTLTALQGGNRSLVNDQALPLNLFVSRSRLCEALETGDKVNVIFCENALTEADLQAAWSPAAAGLQVRADAGRTTVRSERIFLPEGLLEQLEAHNPGSERIFAYLANAIDKGAASIPYSFVTARQTWQGRPLAPDAMVLSDYAARRLGAAVGDTVRIRYFVTQGLKQLSERTAAFAVAGIAPLSAFAPDPGLRAGFPGLAEADRCTDWDSDLPIDMSRIGPEDEAYWAAWRDTPKALVGYDGVRADWASAYGSATALLIPAEDPDLSGLTPAMSGVQVAPMREEALRAAAGGIDFAGLFLALGCFVIAAALLLLVHPVREMCLQRTDEFRLLAAAGYPRRRVTALLRREAAPVIVGAALAGLAAGILYCLVTLLLLGSVWKGATHADGWVFRPAPASFAAGPAAAVLLAFGVLELTLRRALSERRRKLRPARSHRLGAILSTVLLAALVLASLWMRDKLVIFVLVGCAWMLCGALWALYLLERRGGRPADPPGRTALVWRTLHAERSQNLTAFLSLALGVFAVLAVGLNRQNFTGSEVAGTGGYALWGETSAPFYHLPDLPEGEFLPLLRVASDDASCLNLNHVERPTVLGVDLGRLAGSFPVPEAARRPLGEDLYPVLVDETVLTWSLMRQVGDTLRYRDAQDRPVGLVIAGTLPNTLFQGNLLLDEPFFRTLWPDRDGCELFLVRTDEPERAAARLEALLNEYGVRVQPAGERMRELGSVTDTYLSIFLVLGGIGLLLGLVSLLVVIRRSLAVRRGAVALWRALGMPATAVQRQLQAECLAVPVSALLLGTSGALVSVCTAFANISAGIWLTAALFLILSLVLVVTAVRRLTRQASLTEP